jgi:hypothetical protein
MSWPFEPLPMFGYDVIVADPWAAVSGLPASRSQCKTVRIVPVLGFKEGSPEYAQCRMAMLQRRDNADAAYRARVSSTLQNFNNTVQNNRVDYSTYNNTPPYSPPRRVTCRQTLGIGNPVVCE